MRGTVIAQGVVKPEWIDVNGHMNVAWYVLAFDLGVDALWEEFGITTAYIDASRNSTFAVESHITYQKELLEAQRYTVTSQVLAFDDKRVHQFQRLYHSDTGHLSATAEWMNVHVDLTARRVSQWPQPILDNIGKFSRNQADHELPEEFCGRMRVRNPHFDLYRPAP